MNRIKLSKKMPTVGVFYQKYGILFILVLEIIFFAIAHENFLTSTNLLSVGRQISFIGIASIGMTMVMITGGIDISVGSMLALAGVVSAKLLVDGGVPLPLAIILTLLVGTFFGLINGVTSEIMHVPPLISTLAMQTILKGIAFLITNALPVKGVSDSFKYLGQGYLWGWIPVPFLTMLLLFVVGWWFLEKSYFGRRIYVVGGNKEAARLSGIDTKKVIISTYALCGFFAALAGILMAGRLGSGQPSIGTNFPMDVLTATVLGGISVNGGKGSIVNVFFGAFIMGILSNGMIMLGLNEYWQWLVKGFVLLFAVSMSNLKSK
ncbi:ABC transporter permease [Sediminispirochaeta smaragdinae]|uniref:Inner-membrane translocator n=1 Tax=Sediminispirochaeta smaragdinae (strain DSM 11293 / JCM 15392 / SEBR 4228) TaxID=573413 RepID=E1R8N1_SEDSS|nr:ABC transporter permease [Sediminispirochaeta smaragdinae]ADK81788.1 inner-membrane translocator [Sediminispirochaeta smaragdinae DSM 11293]